MILNHLSLNIVHSYFLPYQGEEVLEDLFTYREGDEVIYFNPEAPKEQTQDITTSSGATITFGKGEVTTQGDESEDVEILKAPEERRPIDEPATGEASVKVYVTEAISIGLFSLRLF